MYEFLNRMLFISMIGAVLAAVVPASAQENGIRLEPRTRCGEKDSHQAVRFTGLACPHLGRILLNDVVACEAAAKSREECLVAIETISKVATVPFEK